MTITEVTQPSQRDRPIERWVKGGKPGEFSIDGKCPIGPVAGAETRSEDYSKSISKANVLSSEDCYPSQQGAECEVDLIIPMSPKMELVAARTAANLAKMMDFDENHIDAIQLAAIEACINAFEHSKSKDKQVFVKFIITDDALELKISDHGAGFRPDAIKPSTYGGRGPKKRGWGLEIIRNMMDTVYVQSNTDGTTITMIKRKMPSELKVMATNQGVKPTSENPNCAKYVTN